MQEGARQAVTEGWPKESKKEQNPPQGGRERRGRKRDAFRYRIKFSNKKRRGEIFEKQKFAGQE